jgi:2-epi-5-epi-valiolone epimerase
VAVTLDDKRPPAGVPGAQRVDHVGLTVPDLDGAISFVIEALGGELVYRQPRLARDDDWMQRHLDVHPRAVADIALVGLGPARNLELFQYWAPDHNAVPPRPHDVGGTHLGLYVDDVEAAAAGLRDRHGLRTYGPVRTVEAGSPSAGTRWVRLSAPWGMPIELRSAASPRPTAGYLALTVADLDEAVVFFVATLGASLLYRTEADVSDPAVAAALGVSGVESLELAALRLGPTDHVELSCFRPKEAKGARGAKGTRGTKGTPPRNSDAGGRHLAIRVDDVDAAASYLRSASGCTVLGPPETVTAGPVAGVRWVYVRTSLGLHIELTGGGTGEGKLACPS